jgi:hypothetical protein
VGRAAQPLAGAAGAEQQAFHRNAPSARSRNDRLLERNLPLQAVLANGRSRGIKSAAITHLLPPFGGPWSAGSFLTSPKRTRSMPWRSRLRRAGRLKYCRDTRQTQTGGVALLTTAPPSAAAEQGLEGHLMPEDIDYRGYHLSIMHSAPRWYAAIHPRLSHQAKPNPRKEIASGATREEAIAEAERTVDRLLKV